MLYYYNHNATIIDSVFDGNVGIKGSVLLLWGQNHNLHFARNTVINNHAPGSGTIYFLDDNRHTMVEDCRFVNNSVGTYGGAIYLDDGFNFTVRGCDFRNNSAVQQAVRYPFRRLFECTH
jgi:predicted outer membrane repeat protein